MLRLLRLSMKPHQLSSVGLYLVLQAPGSGSSNVLTTINIAIVITRTRAELYNTPIACIVIATIAPDLQVDEASV